MYICTYVHTCTLLSSLFPVLSFGFVWLFLAGSDFWPGGQCVLMSAYCRCKQFLGKEKEMTYMSWCSLRLLRYLFNSSTRSLWVLIPSRFSRSLSCMFQVVRLAVCTSKIEGFLFNCTAERWTRGCVEYKSDGR